MGAWCGESGYRERLWAFDAWKIGLEALDSRGQSAIDVVVVVVVVSVNAFHRHLSVRESTVFALEGIFRLNFGSLLSSIDPSAASLTSGQSHPTHHYKSSERSFSSKHVNAQCNCNFLSLMTTEK